MGHLQNYSRLIQSRLKKTSVKMMKQLLFVLFLATVVFMVSAEPLPEVDGEKTKVAGDSESEAEAETGNGSSMTTLASASLIGLAFNLLMNVWQWTRID